MQRLPVVLTLVAATALLAATSSTAKEGVQARIVTPIAREAAPGTRVTFIWTLTTVDEGGRVPFGASGIFIRLFGPGGERTPRAYATELAPGRYHARPRVPDGGVRRVVIGLMGISCGVNGCRRSPAVFRIVGPAFR
jgi:hypothetical protein